MRGGVASAPEVRLSEPWVFCANTAQIPFGQGLGLESVVSLGLITELNLGCALDPLHDYKQEERP